MEAHDINAISDLLSSLINRAENVEKTLDVKAKMADGIYKNLSLASDGIFLNINNFTDKFKRFNTLSHSY